MPRTTLAELTAQMTGLTTKADAEALAEDMAQLGGLIISLQGKISELTAEIASLKATQVVQSKPTIMPTSKPAPRTDVFDGENGRVLASGLILCPSCNAPKGSVHAPRCSSPRPT